jgi:CheY-like chemotaxis protein
MTDSRVLFVEDDLNNVVGTVALLENAGVQVDMAESMEAATEALKGTRYQLMLLDWALPLKPDGPCDMQAGQKLVDSLQGGSLGALNHDTPYFVITKQTDEFGTAECRGRLGVLTKLDALGIRKHVLAALRGNVNHPQPERGVR